MFASHLIGLFPRHIIMKLHQERIGKDLWSVFGHHVFRQDGQYQPTAGQQSHQAVATGGQASLNIHAIRPTTDTYSK